MSDTMQFTSSDTKELRRIYKAAVAMGVESFTFKGHELLVSYAKYLLEYLEGRNVRDRTR